MQNIQQYEELSELRRWLLVTANAHSLYEQYGFTPLSKPDRWMEIFTPYIITADTQPVK